MRPTGLLLSGLMVALLTGEATGSTYYLYSPAPATEQQVQLKTAHEIAVQEITVTKGDSLYKISRSNSGKGMYYPQLLLFNKIANPRLIHPGQVLRVPLAKGQSPGATGKPVPQVKSATVIEPTAVPALAPVAPAPALQTSKKTAEAAAPAVRQTSVEAAEQTLYAKGVRAYKSGKCRQAIASFDRFLSRYPESLLSADASLYRADCYLNLAKK
jgi:TolA-binding protein